MIIGFTGTQNGMNKFQKSEFVKLLNQFNPTELHHGDCIGADLDANNLFLEWHCANDIITRTIVLHIPNKVDKQAFSNNIMKDVRKSVSDELAQKLLNCKYKISVIIRGAKPYLMRNRDIVDESSILIACPKEMEHTLRSGTWATIRYGWQSKGKQVIVIPPIVE